MGTINQEKSFDALYMADYLRQLGYKVTAPAKNPEDMTLEELASHVDEATRKKREYHKRWREKNREKIREYNREYRMTHKDSLTEEQKEKNRIAIQKWKKAHPDKVLGYWKKWAEKNPEKISEYGKKWREKHPEYGKIRYAREKQLLEDMKKEYRKRIRQDIKQAKAQKREGNGNV